MRKKSSFPTVSGLTLAAAVFAAPMSGHAQDAETARPPLLEGLLACRAITATDARLACFDTAATAFDTAEQQGEVTVIDRVQARETRTRLFGLNLETANLFGRLRQDDQVDAIETTLTSARQDGQGKAIFVLADGSTWRQVDSERINARLTPGATIRIRQAAVGSFLLSVNGARSVRARRDR